MFTLSRTLETVVPPTISLISPDEVDERVLVAAALGQRQFAARNLDDDGNKIFGAIELEVIDLHGDGELGDRDLRASAHLQAGAPCPPR